MYFHEVWVIVNDDSKGICFSSEGQLCVYRTQQEAVLEMAKYIKLSPDKTLSLRKTKVMLPWI